MHGACYLCFFFQAEDGIRDLTVTGVQTCALPIWGENTRLRSLLGLGQRLSSGYVPAEVLREPEPTGALTFIVSAGKKQGVKPLSEIGRGSGRERGEISGGAVCLKKKIKGVVEIRR